MPADGLVTDIGTHALALLRYGLIDPSGKGLHDIWGAGNTTVQARASLAVVTLAIGPSRTRALCSKWVSDFREMQAERGPPGYAVGRSSRDAARYEIR